MWISCTVCNRIQSYIHWCLINFGLDRKCKYKIYYSKLQSDIVVWSQLFIAISLSFLFGNQMEQPPLFGCSTEDSSVLGFTEMMHPDSFLPRRNWNHPSSACEAHCWFGPTPHRKTKKQTRCHSMTAFERGKGDLINCFFFFFVTITSIQHSPPLSCA